MFSSIPSGIIQVGKAIKKELFDLISGNLDDLDDRLTAVEGVQPLIEIFNDEVINSSSSITLTGLAFYKAQRNMRLVKAELQIFEKGATPYSGFVQIDFKKGSDLNALNSVFSTPPTLELDMVPDYATDSGVFNPTYQDVLTDEFIRFDVTLLPTANILGKFRIVLYGVAI